MKILHKLMCAIILPLGALAVSCAENDNWEPGAPDVEGCYEVFFPEQENIGDLEVDPEAELEFTYTAQRNNADGAITVPVVVSRNTGDLYSVSPIEFADGEDVTTFTVTLSEQSELSTRYDFEIDIVDPLYTPQYTAAHNTSLKLSITRVKWTEEASGTFISAFWEESTPTKLYRKDNSSYFKVTNFLGLGTDLFFEWDEKSNLCQIDGFIYTGFDYQGNPAQGTYFVDGIGFYDTWLGYNYTWETLEQNGISQPYYDPDKKAFFFHVYAAVPAVGDGMGFGWFDEVFLLDGGSLGCDLAIQMMLPSEFNPQLSSAYSDEDNLIYLITGTNLTSLHYAILPTDVYNNPAAAGIEDLEAFLVEYGIDGSEKDSDGYSELDYIAEDGVYAGLWINRTAGTSYTMFAKASNANGESAYVTCEYTTAEATVEVDPDGAVQGNYTMTCEPVAGVVFTNHFSVIPRDGANEFFVKSLGYDKFNNQWYATYDEAASTLTLNGIEKGYEDDGNTFGLLYGYANSAKTQVYGFFSFASDESEGDDPCVFAVNPATGKLSELNTAFMIPVFDYSTGQAGSVLGYLGYYAAGTTVEVAVAGASARVANISFSSVRNFEAPKMNVASSGRMLDRLNVCNAAAQRIATGKVGYKSVKPGVRGAKLSNAAAKL